MTSAEKIAYLINFGTKVENIIENNKFMLEIASVPSNVIAMKALCKDNKDVKKAYSMLLAAEFNHKYEHASNKDAVLDNFSVDVVKDIINKEDAMREISLAFLALNHEEAQLKLIRKWYHTNLLQLQDILKVKIAHDMLSRMSLELAITEEIYPEFVSQRQLEIENNLKQDYDNLRILGPMWMNPNKAQYAAKMRDIAPILSVDTLIHSKYLFKDTGYFGVKTHAMMINHTSIQKQRLIAKCLAQNTLQDQKTLLNILTPDVQAMIYLNLDQVKKQEMLDSLDSNEQKQKLKDAVVIEEQKLTEIQDTTTQNIINLEGDMPLVERESRFNKRRTLLMDNPQEVIQRAVVWFLVKGDDYIASRDNDIANVIVDFGHKDTAARLDALLSTVKGGDEIDKNTATVEKIVEHIHKNCRNRKVPLALSNIINTAKAKMMEPTTNDNMLVAPSKTTSNDLPISLSKTTIKKSKLTTFAEGIASALSGLKSQSKNSDLITDNEQKNTSHKHADATTLLSAKDRINKV